MPSESQASKPSTSKPRRSTPDNAEKVVREAGPALKRCSECGKPVGLSRAEYQRRYRERKGDA